MLPHTCIVSPYTHFDAFFFYCYGAHRALHSFPTRRSSDLDDRDAANVDAGHHDTQHHDARSDDRADDHGAPNDHASTDRKSTRLNSSHVSISYAVFCLKKKNKFLIIRRIDVLLLTYYSLLH